MFAAIIHDFRENFYFVFYSKQLNTIWILSFKEFLKECTTNKNGKNAGKHSIWFNGNKKNQLQVIKKNIAMNDLINIYVRIFQDFINNDGSKL